MMINLPDSVQINEVAPRDGLQSFPAKIDIETKVNIVNRLTEAGLPLIEVSGFAHPNAIPNLADAEQLFERIERKRGVIYRGLVPNSRGAERAVAAKVDEMLGLTILSETYLKKNQNMTHEKAFDEAVRAFRIADHANIRFVMALGMSFWCPYEGVIPPDRVVDSITRFRNAGIKRFYLAGSVGMEDAVHVNELFQRLRLKFPDIDLGYHIHNMSGMAPANILAALDGGACFLEGAICGIGGGIAMPAHLGSVGNFPTEDLVDMLEHWGVHTGLCSGSILAAAKDIAKLLDIHPRSRTGQGITREALYRVDVD